MSTHSKGGRAISLHEKDNSVRTTLEFDNRHASCWGTFECAVIPLSNSYIETASSLYFVNFSILSKRK